MAPGDVRPGCLLTRPRSSYAAELTLSLNNLPMPSSGLELSVGSVGDSYDYALAETVIGLFKTEVIRRRGPWRSMEAVEFATLGWVDWFNHRRLLEPIGNMPPAEAEDATTPG